MSFRLLGAVLVFAGCGGFGFSIAANIKNKERMLNQLMTILENIECELQYQLTPLPQLCRHAVIGSKGSVRDVFLNLSRELDWMISPDVCTCMRASIRKTPGIPPEIRRLLLQLGNTLGRFDLSGQVQGIQMVKQGCRGELSRLSKGKEARIRSYQTLGLCAGAALVILLV